MTLRQRETVVAGDPFLHAVTSWPHIRPPSKSLAQPILLMFPACPRRGELILMKTADDSRRQPGAAAQDMFSDDVLQNGTQVTSQNHCAYNQTRECFLGFSVKAIDFSYSQIETLVKRLVVNADEGLWLVTSRDVPASAKHSPVDLIYLDHNCRVLSLVESLPSDRIRTAIPKVASILILPPHSIISSETQLGDQVVLCLAGEMDQRLEGTQGSLADCRDSRRGLLPHPTQADPNSDTSLTVPTQSPARPNPQPGPRIFESMKSPWRVRSPKSFLARWLSFDRRRSPRLAFPGLAAYYWTGSAPQAHSIRDISNTGLYVVTNERWYPGTIILMTLQIRDLRGETPDFTIAIQSRATRWGKDGVGLTLVLPQLDGPERRLLSEGADQAQFERFRKQLSKHTVSEPDTGF